MPGSEPPVRRTLLTKASQAVGLCLLVISAYAVALYAFDWNHGIGVGSAWSYDVGTPSGYKYNETETLRSLEVCGFRICGVYEAKSQKGTAIQWRTSDWQLERSIFVDPSGNSRDLVYDSGLRLYNLPMVVGDKWSWDTGGTRTTTVHMQNGGTLSKNERVIISDVTRQVMKVEEVIVPAGTFQCYLIDQRDQNDMTTQRIWFNSEVGGAVKYIGGFGGVYYTAWELTRYALVADPPLSLFEAKIFSVDVSLLASAGVGLLALPMAIASLRGRKAVGREGAGRLDRLAHVEEVDADGYGANDEERE